MTNCFAAQRLITFKLRSLLFEKLRIVFCAFLVMLLFQMERYLLNSKSPVVATVYAPIIFPPASVLMFKQLPGGNYRFSFWFWLYDKCNINYKWLEHCSLQCCILADCIQCLASCTSCEVDKSLLAHLNPTFLQAQNRRDV